MVIMIMLLEHGYREKKALPKHLSNPGGHIVEHEHGPIGLSFSSGFLEKFEVNDDEFLF